MLNFILKFFRKKNPNDDLYASYYAVLDEIRSAEAQNDTKLIQHLEEKAERLLKRINAVERAERQESGTRRKRR
jgi:hypothetical protein